MNNYIFFDDISWKNLLPLTFTRPCADIRTGILTIKEKWEKLIGSEFSYLTPNYLSDKYKLIKQQDNILINGSVLPDYDLLEEIFSLKQNQAIINNDRLIAVRLSDKDTDDFIPDDLRNYQIKNSIVNITKLENVWDIFTKNNEAIKFDYKLLTNGRKSGKLSKTNNILSSENIFIEKDAKIEYATLNAENGPIYIGKNAEIMEGTVIRGPFALCNNSVVKLSAKIYGPTTIGPFSKVGGELNNVVVFGFSNKAHDGFLGNSVIGEWCNIGADTNNSNLKNNYASVRLWNYNKEKFIDTGLQFCGLIMGDHSKCGINTMFNTGTVVGVNVNIFGSGFPRNFTPSFSWGGHQGFTEYKINKALEVAEKVMARRDKKLCEADKKIFNYIFDKTGKYRRK